MTLWVPVQEKTTVSPICAWLLKLSHPQSFCEFEMEMVAAKVGEDRRRRRRKEERKASGMPWGLIDSDH